MKLRVKENKMTHEEYKKILKSKHKAFTTKQNV